MYQGGNQQFASPGEALAHVSETPWSNWTKADYTIEQWHAACLIHIHDGAPTSKSQCKLPVKTPDGVLNRNGVHAAAAALAGARGGLKGVSADQKKQAGNALKRYYAQLDEEAPDSLSQVDEFVGEFLEHHGVKGMRWGVQKKEETSGQDRARGEAQKSELTKVDISRFATSNATLRTPTTSNGRVGKQANAKTGGLTPTQKKALIGVGVGVVAVGGYIAYRHYAAGRRPPGFDVSELAHRPLSNRPLGKLGGGHPAYDLSRTNKLMVDTSKGYADIRSVDGFPNEYVAKRHAELISTFEEMREKFPAVRNLNVEVVPMSHAPGMEMLAAQKSPAAVMAMRKGEARIFYNDVMDGLTDVEAQYVKQMQPGVFKDKFLGYHEMGHVLAVAHGDMPPTSEILASTNIRGQIKWGLAKNKYHKQLFRKHGFSFKELSKLSPYAATEPAEALAELAGNYFTPSERSKMSPDTLKRAKALFDEMGGVT